MDLRQATQAPKRSAWDQCCNLHIKSLNAEISGKPTICISHFHPIIQLTSQPPLYTPMAEIGGRHASYISDFRILIPGGKAHIEVVVC